MLLLVISIKANDKSLFGDSYFKAPSVVSWLWMSLEREGRPDKFILYILSFGDRESKG